MGSIIVGEHVLVISGSAFFLGCNIFDFTSYALDNGLGVDVAVLGGLLVMEDVAIQQFNIVSSYDGAGASVFVGGKCMASKQARQHRRTYYLVTFL